MDAAAHANNPGGQGVGHLLGTWFSESGKQPRPPRRAHLASVSLSEDFGQVFVIPTSAEAALTDTMLVCPMMF